MKKYKFEFELLSPFRFLIGINYSTGILHEESGDKEFSEFMLGLLFFNVSLIITKEKGGS